VAHRNGETVPRATLIYDEGCRHAVTTVSDLLLPVQINSVAACSKSKQPQHHPLYSHYTYTLFHTRPPLLDTSPVHSRLRSVSEFIFVFYSRTKRGKSKKNGLSLQLLCRVNATTMEHETVAPAGRRECRKTEHKPTPVSKFWVRPKNTTYYVNKQKPKLEFVRLLWIVIIHTLSRWPTCSSNVNCKAIGRRMSPWLSSNSPWIFRAQHYKAKTSAIRWLLSGYFKFVNNHKIYMCVCIYI